MILSDHYHCVDALHCYGFHLNCIKLRKKHTHSILISSVCWYKYGWSTISKLPRKIYRFVVSHASFYKVCLLYTKEAAIVDGVTDFYCNFSGDIINQIRRSEETDTIKMWKQLMPWKNATFKTFFMQIRGFKTILCLCQ